MRKVLVATWGDPKRWHLARYYKDSKLLGESKTTYIPLFVEEKPDIGIIIVQNSLYPVFNVWDETSLKEEIRKILVDFGASNDIINKTKVIVTISSGMYEGVKYEATFYDILLNLFIQLYFELKDNVDEVILDLTHGINYLPIVTLLALSYLQKILGFRLRVYNATPVKGGKDSINDSWVLDLGYVNIEPKIKINADELKEIQSLLKKEFRNRYKLPDVNFALKIIVSYIYGLVFPLVYNSYHFDLDDSFIGNLIPRQVTVDGKNFTVDKKDSDKIFKLLIVLLLANSIARMFKQQLRKGKVSVNLDTIKAIIGKIRNPVAKKLIENEYEIIKLFYEKCSDNFFEIREGRIRYKEALEMLRNTESKEYRYREVSAPRNFFAHASFSQDKTYLRKDKVVEFEGTGEADNYIEEILRNEIEI